MSAGNMHAASCAMYLMLAIAPVAFAVTAWADANGLTIDPDTVKLSRFDGVPASLLISAPVGSGLPVGSLELSHAATAGLTVDTKPQRAGPEGPQHWLATVSASPDSPDQGFVLFQVGTKVQDADQGEGAWQPIGEMKLRVRIEPTRDASPADDVDVFIELPATTLRPNTETTAFLKLVNKTSQQIRFQVVEVLAPEFLEVRTLDDAASLDGHETRLAPMTMRMQTAPPRGAWSLTLRVALSRGDGSFVQSAIVVADAEITVGTTAENGEGAKFIAAPAREESPAKALRLELKTDFDTISELVPEAGYLTIHNTGMEPIRLESIKVHGPAFLRIEPQTQETEIAPQETLIVPLALSVNEKGPRIGKWLLLGEVAVVRGSGVLEQRGVGIVETKIEVGVPGVSEVLTLLQLPSILLVPGALILATWSLLLKKAEPKPEWLTWKSSSFWLVAVTLSILVFWSLTLLRQRGIIAADFLVAFGVRDAAWLWLGSVGGAAVTFGGFKVIRWLWGKWQHWQEEQERRRREPMREDKPLAILRKLHVAKLPFYLQTYEYGAQTVFQLGFENAAENAWVIPPILVTPRNAPRADANLLQKIETANDDPRNGLPEMITALKAALEAGSIDEPIWEFGVISCPEQVPRGDLLNAGLLSSPIRIEYGGSGDGGYPCRLE